jgi:hypothetical protein
LRHAECCSDVSDKPAVSIFTVTHPFRRVLQ